MLDLLKTKYESLIILGCLEPMSHYYFLSHGSIDISGTIKL